MSNDAAQWVVTEREGAWSPKLTVVVITSDEECGIEASLRSVE